MACLCHHILFYFFRTLSALSPSLWGCLCPANLKLWSFHYTSFHFISTKTLSFIWCVFIFFIFVCLPCFNACSSGTGMLWSALITVVSSGWEQDWYIEVIRKCLYKNLIELIIIIVMTADRVWSLPHFSSQELGEVDLIILTLKMRQLRLPVILWQVPGYTAVNNETRLDVGIGPSRFKCSPCLILYAYSKAFSVISWSLSFSFYNVGIIIVLIS